MHLRGLEVRTNTEEERSGVKNVKRGKKLIYFHLGKKCQEIEEAGATQSAFQFSWQGESMPAASTAKKVRLKAVPRKSTSKSVKKILEKHSLTKCFSDHIFA